MVNPEYNILDEWMFGKLNNLLENLDSNSDYFEIKLSLGEPSICFPEFVKNELALNYEKWGNYPPTAAISRFSNSIIKYIQRRHPGAETIVDANKNILPVPGTREPLHLLGLLAKNFKCGKTRAIVTNPFYHAWQAGSISSGSDIYWVNALPENDYMPDLDDIPVEILKSSIIMYICSPSNPHGGVANIDYLKRAIVLARKFNFILAFDECYNDIFRTNKPKPVGGLDAALQIGKNLNNIIIFNSLSKRSSVPGIRAGFIVGDERIINGYKLLVSNGASPVPIPIQNVAASLYNDDNHNLEACIHYDKNFEIVDKYLRPFYKNFKTPDAGFFLWLKVKDDQEAAKVLWNKFSLKVMPGSFMGKEIKGFNPGKGFLRISIVDENKVVEEAMKRICLFLQSN